MNEGPKYRPPNAGVMAYRASRALLYEVSASLEDWSNRLARVEVSWTSDQDAWRCLEEMQLLAQDLTACRRSFEAKVRALPAVVAHDTRFDDFREELSALRIRIERAAMTFGLPMTEPEN